MRSVSIAALFLLLSTGICWGQADTTRIYLDNFRMIPAFGDPTILEDFEAGVGSWWDPEGSGSTHGTIGDATIFAQDSVNVYEGSFSAMLQYQWAISQPDSAGLIREYPGYGNPLAQTFEFTAYDKLEVWIYGNASGDLFRFCIDDHGDVSAAHEVSKWIPIDWEGWQPVYWDLAVDTVIAWVNGNGMLEEPLSFDSFQILQNVTTAVEPQSDEPKLPIRYELSQNYPNPFNAETSIRFAIPQAGYVSLKIYNVTGQLVRTLVDEEMPAGTHHVMWNGTDQNNGLAASGIYFCRLEAAGYTESIKMTFLR